MSKERNIYPDFSGEIPPRPLGENELKSRLEGEISNWKLLESPRPDNPNKTRRELYQEFSFKDFNEVVKFLNEAKTVCDILPHHPRIENVWATLDLYLSTWAIDYNISYKDIQLAKNLDKIYVNKFKTPPHSKEREIQANRDFFQGLKSLIANDELDSVFENITKFYLLNNDRDESEEFVLLKGQYSQNMKSLREGTSSHEDINIQRNKIRKNLLALITSEVKRVD